MPMFAKAGHLMRKLKSALNSERHTFPGSKGTIINRNNIDLAVNMSLDVRNNGSLKRLSKKYIILY